ncbi:DUF4157 domain-containing protein [Paractinoplanes rhizophilus]|uniref:DUF4157 domain-containing protein n=1 Tax=Paractinoplanes rhizophilus TaxID=1416877 RepID=A0ABW2HZX0_9ACTN
MASRSRPDRPRPLVRAARFVARLLPRSLRPGLPGSTRPGFAQPGSVPPGAAQRGSGPAVGADVTEGLRVRAPWSLVRWYRSLVSHPADAPAARPGHGPAGPERGPGSHGPDGPAPDRHSPGRLVLGGRPSAIGSPARSLGSPARSLRAARAPLTSRGSLVGAPPGGPDVRPGHELAMAPGIRALAASGNPGGSGIPAPGVTSMASGTRDRDGHVTASDGHGQMRRDVAASSPDAAAPGLTGISGTGIVSRADAATGPTVHGDGLLGMVGFGPGGYGFASLAGGLLRTPAGSASSGPVSSGPISSAPSSSPASSSSRVSSSRLSSSRVSASSPSAIGTAAGTGSAVDGLAPGRLARRVRVGHHTPGDLDAHPASHGPGARHGEPLAGQPAAGPTVSDPDGAAGLRVLGAASLPPGSVPDPVGAVTVGPAVGSSTHAGAGSSPAAAVLGRTPRERWEAAVAARPLEAPRELPAAFHAMASAITGRARPPLFTTGPNTRHALAAAGALGATTGTTVHLPAVPASGPEVSAVLAHELTHTKSPVRRPRFLLGGLSGLLDDDERQALAAGRERLSSLTQGASGLASSIGQGASGLASSIGQGASGLASSIGQGASGLASSLGQGASGLASSALSQASSAGAGIVDSLPVGGGGMGAVSEVATRAARAAVIEAAGSPMGSAFSGLAGSAADAFSGLPGAAGNAMSGLRGAAGDAMSDLQGAAGDAIEGVASAVSDAAGGVSNVVGGLAGGGAAGAGKPLDPDQVVEIVERRLLREIERRGGRWAGMF